MQELDWFFYKKNQDLPHIPIKTSVSKTVGAGLLLFFVGLLIFLPVLAVISGVQSLRLFDSFFRSGSLVFGGGHVVLPLLQSEVVPRRASKEMFMAGYGAAHAIPGPAV